MITNKWFSLALLVIILALAQGVSAQLHFDNNSINPADQMNSDFRNVSGLIKIGEYVRAIAYLDRLKTVYGDTPQLSELYKQDYREGKLYPELESFIRKELVKDPNNPLLLSQLGEARYLQEDEAGADSIWNFAIKSAGKDEMIYRYIAESRLRYGLYTAAIDVYLKGRSNLANPVLFAPELADIYEIQHDYPQAVNEYINQLSISPDQINFISARIRSLLEDNNDSLQVIQTIANRIKESPERTELYEILGDLYIKQGQMDKALECYKTVGIKLNDDGQSLIRFATRAYDSRAYVTSISALDEYSRTSKKKLFKDPALLVKAKAQLASGFIDLARESFSTLASGAIDYRIKDEAGFMTGLIYSQNKDNCDSALQVWETMLQNSRDPGFQDRARVEMSICYIKKNDLTKSEELLKPVAANKLSGTNLERATLLLGDLAFYKGDYDQANEAYKQMVKSYPNSDYSNDALERMDVIATAGGNSQTNVFLEKYAQGLKAQIVGKQLEAAVILSDSIFNASPIAEQASFFSAVDYARAQSRDLAITAFKRYVDKNPEGLYIDRAYLELGDLYGQNPNTYPDAKTAYKKILESYPNGPVTELARQRLLNLETPGKIG